MALAVLTVFLLAWTDLRREQQRALDEFSEQQATLALALAADLGGRLSCILQRPGAVPLDGDALLASLPPLHGEPFQVRLLAVDPAGRFALRNADAAPLHAKWRDPSEASGDLASLIHEMRAGGAGAVLIGRDESAAFGLERRTSVGGFAQVPNPTNAHWSIAVVASAMKMRDRARVGVWRLGAATGLAGVLAGLSGLLVLRAQRRALGLAEALRRRDLERSLARAEKLATIGTLAAGIAHEVGTPLGIISGRAEQLLSRAPGGNAGEGMRKGLSSILAQVDKVSATIRQLLDFARTRPVEAVQVSAAQALDSVAALLEHRFRQAKVQLTVDAPPQVPPVAGDPGQLEQVFVNLLINAADACEPGGHVVARASERAGRVAFEIADDGCGIPQEHLAAVLDPFFTTKKRGQGTGLGLTIAADIVKNHGGTLEIESAPGQGTTIRVLLPIAREETK